jgi:hypothetical protein
MLAAMNKVSTMNFAVACNRAGIFPSISAYNYYYGKELFDVHQFEKDLTIFNDLTGTNNLIVSVELFDMCKPEFLNICSKKLFSHLEVIDETGHIYRSEIDDNKDVFEKNMSRLESIFLDIERAGIKCLFKCLIPDHWIKKTDRVKNLFSGAIIKSGDASGKTIVHHDRKTLIEEFLQLETASPDKVFVPTGGIHSSSQVKEFINAGAEIIGIGSYFVTAIECEISTDVKEKIIRSTRHDLSRFQTGQNSIIFSEIDKDDINHSLSLKQGIKNSNVGHICMGSSVDFIDKILPLQDLVDNLMSELI